MTMSTKINPEGFIELVEALAQCESPNRMQLEPLVGAFKDIATLAKRLIELRNTDAAGGKDEERIIALLEERQIVVKELFGKFCEANGKTVEEAFEYMEDPSNYTQQEWEEAQRIRRNIEEKATYSSSSGIDWAQLNKQHRGK